MARYVDASTFEEVAGKEGQLLVAILPEGGFEIVLPAGAEVAEIPHGAEHAAAASADLMHVRSATYYETCVNGFIHVCCNGICRKKKPARSC